MRVHLGVHASECGSRSFCKANAKLTIFYAAANHSATSSAESCYGDIIVRLTESRGAKDLRAEDGLSGPEIAKV
jgi:hypothetical protein